MSDSFVTQFKAAPLWQRAFLICGFAFGLFASVEVAVGYLRGSPEARAYKAELAPIAERLDTAERTGDVAGATSLLKPITTAMNRFNDLPEDAQNRINTSQTRYCVVAAINLSEGIDQVRQIGRWLNRDQYLTALSMCE